ncbi:MAG: NAD(P)/FAD-dependent oxidoreductase [Candidatus Omnitrophica bacterium]|nr:NAD(P)/FAD-dependent oxidoreductase [Candidatus Omnitrophota bacterium]
MTRTDLLIVGAGPAGLTLAWKAAEKGLRVTVIDKKKSADQAAYLTSASFINLREWGIPDEIAQPIDTLHLASRNAFVTVHGLGQMINRRKLLAFLAQQAERRGAQLWFQSTVTDVRIEREGIQRITVASQSATHDFSATVFADCSGVGRVLEQYFQLVPQRRVKQALGVECLVPLRSEPHTIDLYFGSHFGRGYGWLFPLDGRTAILGYGTLDQAKFRNAPRLLDRMFEFRRVSARAEHTVLEVNGGIFRSGAPLRQFHHKNLILVGDIALQGNPVIGEGLRFVMDAARMAADAVTQAIQDNDLTALGRYSATWVKTYYHQYRAGYLTQLFTSLLTAQDRLCDETVRRLRRLPPHALLRTIHGEVGYDNAIKKLLAVCLARISMRYLFRGRVAAPQP